MKPGDLVKLVLPASVAAVHRDPSVPVVWDLDGGVGYSGGFPEGTVAVFLEPHPDEAALATILIEGRVGWVQSRYLEAV